MIFPVIQIPGIHSSQQTGAICPHFINDNKKNWKMSNTNENKIDKKKILVVEDEGDMCLLLNLLLDGQGMEVDHVNTLAGARKFLQTQQPALILLDNRLPDGLGVDFISFLKKHYPDIKIIMITGIDIEAEDAALEIGADQFLPKPFTRAQLHDSISNLLN